MKFVTSPLSESLNSAVGFLSELLSGDKWKNFIWAHEFFGNFYREELVFGRMGYPG